MDRIKQLTTEAQQEIEDGNPVEALGFIIEAITELADALEEQVLYPQQYVVDGYAVIDMD